jgi:hypothetical protein
LRAALLAFTPLTHVALMAGPVIDILISGSHDHTVTVGANSATISGDFTAFHLGLTLAAAIYL